MLPYTSYLLNKMGDKKMSKETETVKVTVTLELPKKIVSFLDDFCRFADTPLNELLREELMQVVKYFYQGGFFEKWIQKAFKSRGISEYFDISA